MRTGGPRTGAVKNRLDTLSCIKKLGRETDVSRTVRSRRCVSECTHKKPEKAGNPEHKKHKRHKGGTNTFVHSVLLVFLLFPARFSAPSGTGGSTHLFECLVDGKTSRLLTGRELLERLQKGTHDRLGCQRHIA